MHQRVSVKTASSSSIDSFDRYRASLHGTTTLTPAEERALSERWRNGDTTAGDKLIRASLPFVISVALEYRRWGIPLEDLVQQGNLGLLKAAHKFDPDRECRLITYAVYWIRAEIRDYVVRGYRLVRIGTTKNERKAVRNYRKTREDNPALLAASSGITVEAAERLLPMLKQRDVSLDVSFEGESPQIDRLVSHAPSPEEQTSRAAHEFRAREKVQSAISKLPAREALIVRERLLQDDPITLEALGSRLGISKERVRQLEERARRRLREDLAELHDAA